MTKETLEQAQTILNKIERAKSELNQMATMLDTVKEDKIKTRIRGMDFELPKAAFRSEAIRRKNELESQLTALENEFTSL